MASNKSPNQVTNAGLWHWPYVALTEVAILELLGALYMLLYIHYVVPFSNNGGYHSENII
jgi:hypothetical protein